MQRQIFVTRPFYLLVLFDFSAGVFSGGVGGWAAEVRQKARENGAGEVGKQKGKSEGHARPSTSAEGIFPVGWGW